MNKIKHFMLAEHTNQLYKKEAASSIALTRDVADKINELVDAYNKLAEGNLAKEQEQDGRIRKAVLYMKDNLINSIHDLLETLVGSGALNDLIASSVLEGYRTLKDKTDMYITVAEFGAEGNGISDDTQAIQRAIAHAQLFGKKIQFAAGATYKVSSLTITKHIDIDFNGATIISTSDDFALKFDCASTPEKRYTISNGKIKAKKGLYLRSNLLTASDMTIDCSVLGLQTSDCYELALYNIKVIGDGNTNSTGFDLHCTDSFIVFCTTTNIAKCFKLDNSTNYIYSLHGWNSMPVAGSTMLQLTSARECILNDIYCDAIENGIISDCPKLTINNFIYAFSVSNGGDYRKLQCFNITRAGGLIEVDGGFLNYTGDNNTFVLSNKFVRIKNLEDRSNLCNFTYTADDGTVLYINYQDGVQVLKVDIEKEIALNLNYLCTFSGLTELPTKTYSGYAAAVETIDNVAYNLKVPVVFDFVAGTGRTVLYVYHEKTLSNVHLNSEM